MIIAAKDPLRYMGAVGRSYQPALIRGMSRSLLKSEQRASLVERLCCPRGIGKIRAG
jgi:hypothetical protein